MPRKSAASSRSTSSPRLLLLKNEARSSSSRSEGSPGQGIGWWRGKRPMKTFSSRDILYLRKRRGRLSGAQSQEGQGPFKYSARERDGHGVPALAAQQVGQ